MKKNDILMLAIVAAGGYVLYNWLKSTGQLDKWFGAATSPATGANPVMAGPAPAIVDPAYAAYLAAQQALAAQGQNSVPSVYRQTPVPVQTSVPTTAPPATATFVSSDPPAPQADPTKVTMLENASKNDIYAVNGLMTADQWNYYRNQLFPPDLTANQFNVAFPFDASWRNNPMTAQQFMAQLAGSGLGDLVSAPRVRSLSFAGPKSAFGGAFRPVSHYKGNYGPNVN